MQKFSKKNFGNKFPLNMSSLRIIFWPITASPKCLRTYRIPSQHCQVQRLQLPCH